MVWSKRFPKLCWACLSPAGGTQQAGLINEMPVEGGIAIPQEKLFHQEASGALEQVVGSPPLVVLRAQLRKATAM